MADPAIRSARSMLMARVRQKGTTPELVVRAVLRDIGLRYRLHRRDLPGRPDISIANQRRAIFVHGCFWHRHSGCKKSTTPRTRREFWLAKFDQNLARDRRNISDLKRNGWNVTVVWECECKDVTRLKKRLKRLIHRSALSTFTEDTGTARRSTVLV